MMRFGLLAIFLLALCSNATVGKPPVTALAFAPDGTTVIVGSQSGVEIRSWPELKVQQTIATAMSQVHDIAVFQDRFAVVGGEPSEFGSIEVYTHSGRRLSRSSRHRDVIYAADWSPDGRQLATAGADAIVMVGEVEGAQGVTLEGHSRGVMAVKYIPNTTYLVTAGLDHSIRIWDLSTNQVERVLDQHRGIVRDLDVRPNQQGLPMIASASADRTVRFWQPTIGRFVRYVLLPAEPLSIAWTPDGSRVVAGCIDGHLRVINADDVTVTADRHVIDGWAYEVAVAPNGEIAIAGADGKVQHVAKP